MASMRPNNHIDVAPLRDTELVELAEIWLMPTGWKICEHHIWNIIMALICKSLLTRVAKSNAGREGGYMNCFHYIKKYTLLQFTYML